MITTGKSERVKIKFREKVKIPESYKSFFWDCPDGETYLEKYILRILLYGSFEDIKTLWRKYGEKVKDVAERYKEVKRGILFWLKLWKDRRTGKSYGKKRKEHLKINKMNENKKKSKGDLGNKETKTHNSEKIDKHIRKIKELVIKIQPHFKRFYLAGGTELMIRHKQRVSEDVHLFSEKPFSFNYLSHKVRKLFSPEKEERFEDNIDFIIEGVKVSFIFFPFKNIKRTETFEGIKMASDYDIFLNKIYSAGRRVETKDVLDFVFLCEKYKWDKSEVKADFERKFPNQSFEIYLGALFSTEDYPDLDEKTKQKLEEIKKQWLK